VGACQGSQLRQAEIGELRITSFGHQDVRGLNVPMMDSRVMRARQCIGDPGQQFDDLSPPPLRVAYPVFERAAIDIFCDDVLLTLEFSSFDNSQNMGMIQGGCHASFLLESTAS